MKLRPFILIVLCTALVQAQHPKTDSLLRLIKSDKPDTNKVNHLNLLSSIYRYSNVDTAVLFGEQAFRLAEALKFTPGIVNACNNQGRAYAVHGNFKDALTRLKTGLNYNLEAKDTVRLIESYHFIGSCYRGEGKYPEALENYFLALRLAEAGRPDELAECYNMIGIIYDYQGNFQESLKYHQLAISHTDAGNYNGFLNSYNNIGMIYYGIDQNDSALTNYNKALKFATKLGDARKIAGIYMNIGGVYQVQKRYSDALKNYMLFLEVSKGMQDPDGLAICYLNIGGAYTGMKKPADAISYMKKAIELAHLAGNKLVFRAAYEGMAKADSMSGNYKSALENYKLSIAYRDSLVNEENTRKTVQQQMQYEFDKKASEAKAVQAKKDAVAAEEKHRQEIVLWCVVAGLTLVVAFAAFIFRAFKQKQKANVEISRQKEIIEVKQKEILDSIYYARRIQRSLLPSERFIQRALEKSQKKVS